MHKDLLIKTLLFGVMFVWVLLFLPGCRSKVAIGVNRGRVQTTRSSIEALQTDPERREAMLAVVESFEQSVLAIENEAQETRRQIIELNRDYDTTREELEQLYARLGALMKELGEVVKVNGLAMRELCSEEEWKRIATDKSALIEFSF